MDTGNISSGASSFNTFKTDKSVNGTKEFLESNSLVAKVAFLLLVLICFVIAIKYCARFLTWVFSYNTSPYLVNGMVDAKTMITIPQDPNSNGSIPVIRSDNANEGVEFSYSVWLFIDDLVYQKGQYKHIFHKGSEGINTTDPGYMGMAYPNNSPGLYLDSKENKLIVMMNTYDKVAETIIVPDVPIHKWISVILRLENRNLDVYVNGTIVARHELKSVPKQNYGNVYANQGGGFSGLMSNLRYFNRALTITEIQQIVSAGPNMSSSSTLSIFPPYLSLRWYFDN